MTMALDLTVLDKGLARFLENDLILIFHAGISLDEFKNAANVLLSTLPVLGGKLNFLVSDQIHLFPLKNTHQATANQDKTFTQ